MVNILNEVKMHYFRIEESNIIYTVPLIQTCSCVTVCALITSHTDTCFTSSSNHLQSHRNEMYECYI